MKSKTAVTNKYGDAAVRAREICVKENSIIAPMHAWNQAVAEAFPKSHSLREKSCPRCAYLGLCTAGFVLDVPPDRYTRSKLNKGYAVQAVALLEEDNDLAEDLEELWKRLDTGRAHNSQMDVVVALWNNEFIVP